MYVEKHKKKPCDFKWWKEQPSLENAIFNIFSNFRSFYFMYSEKL